MKNETLYKIKSVILGHAVGDALGVPVEFASREELDSSPIEDMEGFGTYPYDAGAWSDDTSMSLCALDSLAKGDIYWDEIMQNFRRWIEKGEYTSVGECFDAGRTCVKAVLNYFSFSTPAAESGGTDEYSNGNGSLMRILPFVLFTEYGEYAGNRLDIIHKGSALTHAHERSKIGCGIYANIMHQLLREPAMASVERGLRRAELEYSRSPELHHYKRIFESDFKDLKRNDIKSTGYVVDTLEAALWCLMTTDNFRDCVLKAVNLGNDTDTVAAVAGGMAGALYGYDAIPKEWLNTLMRREYIEDMCEKACRIWQETKTEQTDCPK